MYADSVKQLRTSAAILLITNSYYSLLPQDQTTPCTGWGGYWINIWGKGAADREDNQAAGSSKAYQQARNLSYTSATPQLHLQRAHGKIYHTLCAADEVTSLHARS